MTSPDNPFGHQDNFDQEQSYAGRFSHEMASSIGCRNGKEVAASPESGAKKTMYSQLQEEIKLEVRRRSEKQRRKGKGGPEYLSSGVVSAAKERQTLSIVLTFKSNRFLPLCLLVEKTRVC